MNLCERDKIADAHLDQFFKDQEELQKIKSDEQKALAAQLQAVARSEEARKREETLKVLQDQKEVLWECLTQRVAEVGVKRDQRIEAGEEESRVDITMDTSKLDYLTVIEQGRLPAALQPVENQVYSHLVSLEMNEIQWRYEALSYMTSILKANQEACDQGNETRGPGEAYPRIWAYLGYRNLLTQYEKDSGREDPYTSAEARFKAWPT